MVDDLYETIGGRRTVRAATASFYRRVLEDETLRDFFDSTDMAHLRARQSMFISMLLGGKVVYTGKEIGPRMPRREPRDAPIAISMRFSNTFARPWTKSGSTLTRPRR